jgi:co-chaperonin GroES (HSP10)
MKIKALRNEVIVERIIKEQTGSGLYIPQATKNCMRGTVVSVGNKVDADINEGDTIIFPRGTGQLVGEEPNNADKLVMLKQEDILGIIIEE